MNPAPVSHALDGSDIHVRWRYLDARDGATIAWWDLPAREKPPAGRTPRTLVLANGLGGTMDVWRRVLAGLPADLRVISWDYRGLYHSSPPADLSRLGISQHGDDLDLVLDAAGVTSAVFAGWSIGVQVLLEYCRRRPSAFQGLVLINGTARTPFSAAFDRPRAELYLTGLFSLAGKFPGATSRLIERGLALEDSFELLKLLGLIALPAAKNEFAEFAHAFQTVNLRVYSEMIRRLGMYDGAAAAREVTCPALVLAGEKDPFTPLAAAGELAQMLPRGRLVVLPGATHYAMIEYPRQMTRELIDFLTACDARDARPA